MSLTSHGLTTKQKGIPYIPPTDIISQMQSNGLKDQALICSDSYDRNTNVLDPSETDITVLEK